MFHITIIYMYPKKHRRLPRAEDVISRGLCPRICLRVKYSYLVVFLKLPNSSFLIPTLHQKMSVNLSCTYWTHKPGLWWKKAKCKQRTSYCLLDARVPCPYELLPDLQIRTVYYNAFIHCKWHVLLVSMSFPIGLMLFYLLFNEISRLLIFQRFSLKIISLVLSVALFLGYHNVIYLYRHK